jgi:hypothetical protein
VGNNVEEDLTLIPIEKRPNVSALSQTYRGILVGILKDFPNGPNLCGHGGLRRRRLRRLFHTAEHGLL